MCTLRKSEMSRYRAHSLTATIYFVRVAQIVL